MATVGTRTRVEVNEFVKMCNVMDISEHEIIRLKKEMSYCGIHGSDVVRHFKHDISMTTNNDRAVHDIFVELFGEDGLHSFERRYDEYVRSV